jgi:serine/threonine protein kinase
MDSVDDCGNDDANNDGPHRSSRPPFPEPGSTIGPDGCYFCLGRLGKGTFCAIHKCVDLSRFHRAAAAAAAAARRSGGGVGGARNGGGGGGGGAGRIVAAKVELANFVDSGVIDGEASVLRFLDSSLPPGAVPAFVDYVRHVPHPPGAGGAQPSSSSSALPPPAASAASASDGGLSAIIMEYLPGEDMHLLRDRHCQQQGLSAERPGGVTTMTTTTTTTPTAGGAVTRRLSAGDAVYLVADVVLPLLRAMHGVGIVHRDVKPSVSFFRNREGNLNFLNSIPRARVCLFVDK